MNCRADVLANRGIKSISKADPSAEAPF